MNAADLDDYLERTVRFDGMSIPPEACREEDGPTVSMPAPAMAALAARSALSTSRRAAYSGYPTALTAQASPRALGRGGAHASMTMSDDPAMRNAVIGIWMVAAFLFATLGILVK